MLYVELKIMNASDVVGGGLEIREKKKNSLLSLS